MALRTAPDHVGGLKGLAFLYFKIGDVDQAAAHLEAAQRAAPADSSIAQALELARRGQGPAPATPEPAAGEPLTAAAQPPEDARLFAGLEGAEEGWLVLHSAAPRLRGAPRHPPPPHPTHPPA